MDYIGNKNSLIVHSYDCEFAEQIHPSNIELFEDLWNALGWDYEECQWCIGGRREKEYLVEVREAIVKTAHGNECICCGETRGVQKAHIIPKRLGGVETMALCPRCHWNYDHDLLTTSEAETIRSYLRSRHEYLVEGAL